MDQVADLRPGTNGTSDRGLLGQAFQQRIRSDEALLWSGDNRFRKQAQIGARGSEARARDQSCASPAVGLEEAQTRRQNGGQGYFEASVPSGGRELSERASVVRGLRYWPPAARDAPGDSGQCEEHASS